MFRLFRLTPGRDAVFLSKKCPAAAAACLLYERMEAGAELPRPVYLMSHRPSARDTILPFSRVCTPSLPGRPYSERISSCCFACAIRNSSSCGLRGRQGMGWKFSAVRSADETRKNCSDSLSVCRNYANACVSCACACACACALPSACVSADVVPLRRLLHDIFQSVTAAGDCWVALALF